MSHSIYLEILESETIFAEREIVDLPMKDLVPKMLTRRRLTRAAKIVIYLSDKVGFKQGRIVYGSSFGELYATANILESISQEETISPTHFQNSVYNTAISYLSMLHENEEEIMTISSGDDTAENILKMGAIKALDGDTLLLIATETLNIEGIEKVNKCAAYLECGIALKVRISKEKETMDDTITESDTKIPISLRRLYTIAKNCQDNKINIIKVVL